MWGIFVVAILLVGVLALIKVFRRRPTLAEIKGKYGEKQVAMVISSLGFPVLHDAYLPSTNGTTQIDHIVRVGNSIAVIETKNLSGVIYGSDRDKNWRQVFVRGHHHPLFNPLLQNAIHEKAVRAIVGSDADIRPIVVMAGSARFPKGIPAGVVPIKDLKQWLRLAYVDAGRVETVKPLWEKVLVAVKNGNNRQSRQDHADTINRARSRDPKKSARQQSTFEDFDLDKDTL